MVNNRSCMPRYPGLHAYRGTNHPGANRLILYISGLLWYKAARSETPVSGAGGKHTI